MHRYFLPVSTHRGTSPAMMPAFTDQNRFLQMVVKAIYDERAAQLHYTVLYERAVTPFQKRQIKHALDDEIKHERMLIDLYRSISGHSPQVPTPVPEDMRDFLEGLKEAFEDELEAAEHYRDLMQMTSLPQVRDQLFELMTDEMEHATRFAYVRAEL